MEKHIYANVCPEKYFCHKKTKYFAIQIQTINCPGQLDANLTGISGTPFD
jgi:hypothetical protein